MLLHNTDSYKTEFCNAKRQLKMNLIKKITRVSQILVLTACALTNNAYAITDPVSITFQGMLAGQPQAALAYYGKTNIPDTDARGCKSTTTFNCYSEEGVSIGTVLEANNEYTHLHRYGNGNTAGVVGVSYHGDSGGIYIRATDLSAFSLNSILFDTRFLEGQNANIGSYEVLGFKDALNPDVTSWDWVADPTYGGKRIAYMTVQNTNEKRTVVVGDQYNFKNVKAVWIHYIGHPKAPAADDDVSFTVNIWNIQLAAPVYICP